MAGHWRGGYQWASVVPRAWTIYFAEMAGVGAELPDGIPPAWREAAEAAAGHALPTTLSEPPLVGDRTDDEAVDRSIDDVKRLVVPMHGLSQG